MDSYTEKNVGLREFFQFLEQLIKGMGGYFFKVSQELNIYRSPRISKKARLKKPSTMNTWFYLLLFLGPPNYPIYVQKYIQCFANKSVDGCSLILLHLINKEVGNSYIKSYTKKNRGSESIEHNISLLLLIWGPD